MLKKRDNLGIWEMHLVSRNIKRRYHDRVFAVKSFVQENEKDLGVYGILLSFLFFMAAIILEDVDGVNGFLQVLPAGAGAMVFPFSLSSALFPGIWYGKYEEI